MIINTNPEFGIEIATVIPYAHSLHKRGLLDGVVTSIGMKPFYYFCDYVKEEHTSRTIDNLAAGLNTVPNNWIHHNAPITVGKTYDKCSPEEQEIANGFLDYSEYELPNYKEKYKSPIPSEKPTVFISNVYNHPDSRDIRHYHHFTIKGLYDIFTLLIDKGYNIIYKREDNKSSGITIDQNECFARQKNANITAIVDTLGSITDYDLCKHFPEVTNFTEYVKDQIKYSYNECQLRLMADCSKFISVCGGNSILSSCFGGDVIIYVTQGRELRPGYFDKNSYFRKLSGANIIPIFDDVNEIKERGCHDYSGIINEIKNNY